MSIEYLVKPSDFEFPLPPERLFGRAAPFVLELGCGDGRFIARLGRALPDHNLLGVDLSRVSTGRAVRRLLKRPQENVRILRGDGRFVVRNLAPPGSIDTLYVNFPDPWPKLRHQERRLLQAPFLELAASRLRPGGELRFTTDHREYFDFAVEEARKTELFDCRFPDAPAEVLQTKYGIKWRARERPVMHARFVQRATRGAFPPTAVRFDMEHMILEGRPGPLGAFEKLVRPFEGGCAVIREACRVLEKEELLFLALVNEEGLRQEVLIEVRPSRRGTYIGVKRFGDPVVTRGVREAIAAVAEWLEARGLEPVAAS